MKLSLKELHTLGIAKEILKSKLIIRKLNLETGVVTQRFPNIVFYDFFLGRKIPKGFEYLLDDDNPDFNKELFNVPLEKIIETVKKL
jgi:hypothetical protein